MKRLMGIILSAILFIGTATVGVEATTVNAEENSVNTSSAIEDYNNIPIGEGIEEVTETQPTSQVSETATSPTEETNPTTPVVTEEVFLSAYSTSLGVGETFEIYGYEKDSTALPTLEWYTSDDSVATVKKTDENTAIITGVGTGNTVIKAVTPEGQELECFVNVLKAPEKVALSKTALCLGKGESFTVNATVDSNSWSQTIDWKSSNTKAVVITVISRDKVKITAKNVGIAVISAKTYNGKTATCKVTVKPAPVSVKLNVSSLQLGKGEPCIIYETVNKNSYANTQNVKWVSYNTKVVTVAKAENNKCVVTARGIGKAKVAVKLYNGKTAYCTVTVKPAPKSVTINPSKIELKLKKSMTVSAVLSKNSYARNITWSSSNTQVAKVVKTAQSKARIESKRTGKAVITAKIYNGMIARCTVTVYRAKVYLSPSSQKDNVYVIGNTNEMEQCYKIAKCAKAALVRNGFLVKMPRNPEQSYQKNTKESNNWGADFHIPIHTNGLSGNTLGTMVMVRQKKGATLNMANCLLNSVGGVTPGKDFELMVIKDLYELNHTTAKAVYIEVEYHDNVKGAKWIINNTVKAGNSIAKGICDYYKIKFV